MIVIGNRISFQESLTQPHAAAVTNTQQQVLPAFHACVQCLHCTDGSLGSQGLRAALVNKLLGQLYQTPIYCLTSCTKHQAVNSTSAVA